MVLRCPGLNGSILGPGTHTLEVTLTLGDGRTLTDRAVWEVPGAAPPAGGPRLRVSPPPGLLTTNQAFDVVLLAEAPGRDVLFGQVVLDGRDITLAAAACIVPGGLATGEIVLTCPGLSGGALGLGTHILEVTLFLSDGTILQGGAVWTVLAATGP